jgi:ribokinase
VGAGANAALGADWVLERCAGVIADSDCVLVSTEISAAAVSAAVRAASLAGVRCVLNPAPPIPAVRELLAEGPLLTPNARELVALAGASGAPAELAAGLAARTRSPVVVTMGGEGALLATPGGELESIGALDSSVVDTTGAGDTFNGVLAAGLAAGSELGDAVRVAVVAAGLSVSQPGARGGMPTAGAIEAALSGAGPGDELPATAGRDSG